MQTDSTSPKKTSRWLSGIMIGASVTMLFIEAWEWRRGDSGRWSSLGVPLGLLLMGLAGFLDPDRGRLYTRGTLVAVAVMLGSIVASLLGR